MSDAVHRWTDAQISEIERELKRYYQKAYDDIAKRMKDILEKMDLRKDMTPSELYEESMRYNRLESIEKQLSDSLKSVNSEAVRIVNGKMVNVYQANYNWQSGQLGGVVPLINKEVIKSILSKQVSPFKMLAVNNLKDRALLESKLTNQLTSGIIQGDSIGDIARRIRSVYESNLSDSIRIARTETTKVESDARMNVGKEAENMGFKVYKKWIATEDERTRPAHHHADGQIVPLDQPFDVGGEKLMYPGDDSGSGWNVINCRCTIVQILK